MGRSINTSQQIDLLHIRNLIAIHLLSLLHLKLNQIYIHCVQKFMIKFITNRLPAIFDHFYIKNSSIHSYATKSNNLFRPPFMLYDIGKRSIKVTGAHIYNYFTKCKLLHTSDVSYNYLLKNHIIINDVSLSNILTYN